MQRKLVPFCFTISVVVLLFAGCKKQTEEYQTALIGDYFPLEVGKYITYKLDSTVYTNLNTVKEVHSYFVQDFVDAQITDNLGRPAYRIRRMIRSNTDTTFWFDNATFVITPLDKTLEYYDNNLRFVKLHEPFKDDYSWKGNSFINTYSNPELQYLDDWDYVFENVAQEYIANDVPYAETITINQRDELLGNPDNKDFYFEINRSYEVYGKGVGLIYKDFLHEAWQPPNITSPNGYYEPNSYGIRLTLINHN
jgi:hypothetical protein